MSTDPDARSRRRRRLGWILVLLGGAGTIAATILENDILIAVGAIVFVAGAIAADLRPFLK